MITRTRTTYVTWDGKEFTSATEANKHEALSIPPCRFCDTQPFYGHDSQRDSMVIRCEKCSIELSCRVDGGSRETAPAEARWRWGLLMEKK
jgi:hypothetical protein